MRDNTDDELFRIIAYLVGAASTTQGETLPLAGFRFVDATARLIDMAESSSHLTADSFLVMLRQDIRDHGHDVMWDEQGFVRWLSDIERKTVLEARRRNLTGESLDGDSERVDP
jgi:hypothetical protein